MNDFQIPEFLSSETVESVHARMMSSLPDDIDKSGGQFPWDFTRPTALEKQYFVEFALVEALKQIVPMFATGEFADYHGQTRHMPRKSATASTGVITVTGAEGVVIPAGAMFSTESNNGVSSVDFLTDEEAIIPSNGSVDINVTCSEVGTVGNVESGTIVIKGSTLSSEITSVTNAEPTTGGTDEEADEDYTARQVEYDQNLDVSYVGSPYDYKRWALSVDGVGDAIVIPASDDSGTVTLVILDANGDPASEALCTEVYNYIFKPDDPYNRLAAINAVLVVKAPTTVTISVSAVLELTAGATLEAVKEAFTANLKEYLSVAAESGEVKYSEITARLYATEGVSDYSSVALNGGTANIQINQDQLPVCNTENISFTV